MLTGRLFAVIGLFMLSLCWLFPVQASPAADAPAPAQAPPQSLPSDSPSARDAVMKALPNLSSPENVVRAKAVQELRALKESNQAECTTLMRDALLTSPRPLTRLGAARVLGLLDDKIPDNVPELLAQLKASDEPAHQLALAHALSLFRAEGGEAMPILVQLIEESDDPVFQERIAFFMPQLGKPKADLIPKLTDMLGNDNSEVRSEVVTCLVMSGSSIIPGLAVRLDDPNEYVRAGIAEVFENLEGAQVAVPKLVEMMKTDTSTRVRSRAMEALGAIPEAAPSLVAALSDVDPTVRWYAVNGLQRMGDAADVPAYFQALWQAVPALSNALDDSDSGVRIWAVRALSRIGEKAQAQRKFVLNMQLSTLRQALQKALRTLNAAGDAPTRGEEIARAHDRKLLERFLAATASS